MLENLRLIRPYLVLLLILVIGRWVLGTVRHVPYEKGHHIFSIVIFTFAASFFYAALARGWRGFGVLRAVGLGMTIGLCAQVVILVATVLSYALGMDTYFNHPTALNVPEAVPLVEALKRRGLGLVIGPLMQGIVAAIGWLTGGLLPREPRVDS